MAAKRLIALGFALGAACTPTTFAADQASTNAGALDRTVLPIQEPKRPVYTELDVRNVSPDTSPR